jgi:site-specific DNA-methyltransferase (adenine-specific)
MRLRRKRIVAIIEQADLYNLIKIKNSMKNKIYYGDNLDVLRRYIKDESVDLCYIDPPFNSKRNYNQIYNNVGSEDKAQAQAFIDTWTWDDMANQGLLEIKTNYNGVFTEQSIDLITGLEKVLKKGALLAYLVSMTLRIAEIHRVLKPTGSFYLHCDPTASHYLKLVLDAIFCAKGGDFLNEIIWHYRRWTGKSKKFQSLHDVIFYYSKGHEHTFNTPYIEYTEGSSDRKKQGVLHRFKKGDKPVLVSNGEVDEKGVRDNDVWQIPFIAPSAKERMGYPTQKPEKLLEKIIQASSNKGDIILDAYCGCGTTVAVAEKLKRQWIGVDITYQSISLILKRLEEQKKDALDNVEINGVPKDFASAEALANNKDDRTRKEFEKWMVLTYSNNKAIINDKKGGDGGIDGVAYIAHNHDRDNKKVIFSVKSNAKLSPTVIRDLNGTLQREEAALGIFLTLYPMPNLVKESKKYGLYHNDFTGNDYPKIIVINVEELLAGERMNLPNPATVLKKAEQHYAEQQTLLANLE